MRGTDFTKGGAFDFTACEGDFTVSEANDFTWNIIEIRLRRKESYETKGSTMQDGSKLASLSMDFAVSVLKLCDQIKGHYSLVNQLERSSTSVGANIREANYAHSKADFVAKLQIALKECYETEYWLELMEKAELASAEIISPLLHVCGSLRRMLVASINTAKMNQGKF